jgi:hypothetical protein
MTTRESVANIVEKVGYGPGAAQASSARIGGGAALASRALSAFKD